LIKLFYSEHIKVSILEKFNWLNSYFNQLKF